MEWFFFRVLCIQKTVGCIVVMTQTNYFSELSDINRIFSLGYLVAVIVVSSNHFVGILLITKIYFFLSSACNDELLSTPEIITFLLHSPFSENCEYASNPIP